MTKFHARLRLALALLLVASGAAGFSMTVGADVANARAVEPTAAALQATWTPIVTLPVGSANGQIAYQFAVEGAIARGPQALSVAPDGTIYLLDSVQQRVHAIANGAVLNTIALPFTSYPKDILATADDLYILDDDNRVLRVSVAGQLLHEYKLPPGLASHQIYRMVSRPNGKVFLWTAYYRVFELERLPATVDLEAGVWQKDRRGRGVQSPGGDQWIGEAGDLTSGQLVTGDGKKSITVHARGLFGSMRLIGFDRGVSQLYVLVEDLYDNAGNVGVELSVQRYHPNGRLTGGVRLPFETFVISPRRPVELAEDGALYALVPTKEGATIYRVELGQTFTSVIPDRALQTPVLAQPASDEPEVVNAIVSPAATSSLTRRQVRDRGYMMADAAWTWRTTYDKFHDGRSRPNDAVRPVQLTVASGAAVADGTAVTGIPYTWGGLDSPWSHSDYQDWTNWSNALSIYYNKNPRENGPLVGNTNTTCTTQCYPSGHHIGSAGIDCSGFVYVAAGFTGNPKKSTSALKTDGVDWKGTATGIPLNIQPMNFFVNDSHTFYYNFALPDATSINTLEATTDGSPQAAKRYDSRRWSDIVAGSSSFPYYRAWWNILPGDSPSTAKTALGAGSMTYGRGQSVWYRIPITGPQNILLTNISGGDADLYVYNSSFGLVGRSTAAGFQSETVRINAAGTYYARVYSYVESPNSTSVNFTIQVPNPVGAGTYDNTSSAVQYQGTWTHSSGWPRASGGTISWSNAYGSVVRLTFTGSRITYRFSMAHNRDQADIYIDNNYEETLSSASADTLWQVARTWSVSPGVHTIEVRFGESGGGYIDLDAFVVEIPLVSAGIYDDTHSRFQYIGGWTLGTATTGAAGAYNQTLHWSPTTQDAATFTFSGGEIAYWYSMAWNRGKAVVTIDGLRYEDVDLFSPSVSWNACTSYYVGPGIHTIHIGVSGRKNAAATNYFVDVDRLVVNGSCGGGGGG